jgi:dTDP-glucose pyrophosphorylase
MQSSQQLPIVEATATVMRTVAVIDAATVKIALVVDGDGRLIGSVSDGDVRRGFLVGKSLQSPVGEIMNTAPLALTEGEVPTTSLSRMRERGIRYVPIVDRARHPIRIVTAEDLLNPQLESADIVLMAGGLGTRLKPLTDQVPKPMLPVGGRPLLEVTIGNLRQQGFRRFHLAVNYKADLIEGYFGNGQRFDVEIRYLRENEKLGTAGALRLLPERPAGPLIVMNGDILTTLDARVLLAAHQTSGAPATLCVRDFTWRLPYGVIKLDPAGQYSGIEEKPLRREMISAGIYVLSSQALAHVPDCGLCDMPTLLEIVAQRIAPVAVFHLREYWLDIGQLDDLRRAQEEITGLFG